LTTSDGEKVRVLVVAATPGVVRNPFVAELHDTWKRRVSDDGRIALTLATWTQAPSLGGFDLVLNLSGVPAGQIAEKLPPEGVLIDLHYAEAEEVSIPVSVLARKSLFRGGELAVRRHPSLVAVFATAYAVRGAMGTIGRCERRSHNKSASSGVEGLPGASYMIFDLLVAEILRTGRIDAYSQLEGVVPAERIPSWWDDLATRARHVWTWLWKTVRNQFAREEVGQWAVAVGLQQDCALRIPDHLAWLPPDERRFFADPFLFEHDGQMFLFMEELLFDDWKGFIVVVPVSRSGMVHLEDRRVALERPHHISFPNVFEEAGDVYMLPEQAASGRLELYRAREMPDAWEVHAVLLEDFQAIDPVLLKHEGTWYLFVTDATDGNQDNNLQLFVAPTMEGPLAPHPANPLRLGLKGSRMAGRIVRVGDRMFRLGQDCAQKYGGAVWVFEILALDPVTYEERFVEVLEPRAGGPFAEALHTFSSCEGIIAIDGMRVIGR